MDMWPFPFLCWALLTWLIIFVGACKKKAGRTKYVSTQNTLTSLCAFTGGIELACCLCCGVLAIVYGTYLFAYGFFAICVIAYIFNVVFATMYWKVFSSKVVPADKERKFKEGKINLSDL